MKKNMLFVVFYCMVRCAFVVEPVIFKTALWIVVHGRLQKKRKKRKKKRAYSWSGQKLDRKKQKRDLGVIGKVSAVFVTRSDPRLDKDCDCWGETAGGDKIIQHDCGTTWSCRQTERVT